MGISFQLLFLKALLLLLLPRFVELLLPCRLLGATLLVFFDLGFLVLSQARVALIKMRSWVSRWLGGRWPHRVSFRFCCGACTRRQLRVRACFRSSSTLRPSLPLSLLGLEHLKLLHPLVSMLLQVMCGLLLFSDLLHAFDSCSFGWVESLF